MLPKFAYFQGELVPYSEAKVGILTHGLNYGTGAFGGVRGYWNEEEQQVYIFRPVDHFVRLLNSSKLLLMDLPHTPEGLTKITKKLIQMEEYKQDVYVRPLIYKADEFIGVRLHGMKDEIAISALPFGKYVSNDTDAHVTFSSWRRIDDNMIPARGKLTGAYINTALIKSDALMSGYDEAIVLNLDGHLSEGSAENIFMIKDGVLVTPPVTDNILEGITRKTVMILAEEEFGMEVVERSIDRTEVYLCEELFLTGTAAQVTAVTKVNHRKIGSGVMGEHTTKFKNMYDDLVRGKLKKYKDWNYPVY